MKIKASQWLAAASIAVLALPVPASATQAQFTSAPLTLVGTERLPEVVGSLNVFAADLKTDRLFVTANKMGTVEVFNLTTGARTRSVGNLGVPHMLAFAAFRNELWVGDHESHSIRILDAASYQELGRIALPSLPRLGLYDEESRMFYIANEGKWEKKTTSIIYAISAETRKIVGQIQVAADNPQCLDIDKSKRRMYVNLRDKNQIAVVNLVTYAVEQTWSAPGMHLNIPIAVDPAGGRVFVAGREPDRFYVFDDRTGHVVFEDATVSSADDIIWDPALKRAYVMGTSGLSIYRQLDADHYQKLTEFPTNGAKIGLFVPERQRFYIINPKTEVDQTALQIYRVNP